MFEAKGDRPQWRTVYDHLAEMSVGEVVSDATLIALLPDAAEGSWRTAFVRAMKEMEVKHKRTFGRVRGQGYRMVEAREHEHLARVQHKRAGRRLASAYSKAHSADRSRLTPEERQRLDALELHLAQQRQMTKRLEARVQDLDEGLKAARREHRQDLAGVSERVDRLAEQLARAGIGEPATAG